MTRYLRVSTLGDKSAQCICDLDLDVLRRTELHRMDSEVDRAAEILTESVGRRLSADGELIPAKLTEVIVKSFLEYVYLGDWPKRHRPLMRRCSDQIIFGYFFALPLNLKESGQEEHRHFAFDPRRFSILSAFFRVVENGGYSIKLATRLRILASMPRRFEILMQENFNEHEKIVPKAWLPFFKEVIEEDKK